MTEYCKNLYHDHDRGGDDYNLVEIIEGVYAGKNHEIVQQTKEYWCFKCFKRELLR